VTLISVPGLSGVSGNETANLLAREGSAHQFVGLEPTLGVSRQNIRQRIKCWLANQHMTVWQGLNSTRRQAGELIVVPRVTAKTGLLSFNRTQSKVVTGLITGHDTD
jgi:hypothetical protein